MTKENLKAFETKINEKLTTLLDKKISIERVGAFGTAIVLAASIGFGKLCLDKKNMTVKHATEITELSNELANKTTQLQVLELQIADLKETLQEKMAEFSEVSQKLEDMEDNMDHLKDTPFVVSDYDMKNQFSLDGVDKNNRMHFPDELYNVRVNPENIHYYDYFEIKLPRELDISFKGLAFEEIREIDNDNPTVFYILAKDLSVVDKENNVIYFNNNFQRIYTEIYKQYRKIYDSDKALELMEKVWENINLVSVKTTKDYSIANKVDPNIISLYNFEGAYALNYTTDSLASKIKENDDVLISMHSIDPDYYVGERRNISTYKVSLSEEEYSFNDNLERGSSYGI